MNTTGRSPSPAVRIWSILAVLSLSASCASMSGSESPRVSLVDLEVAEVTMLETTVRATIRIANPNPDPVELEGASFTLRVDGREIGSGTAPDPATVPRLESRTMPVTFHLSNAAAILRLRTILEARAFDWEMEGRLFARTSLGRRTIRVTERGRLDLQRDLENAAANPRPGE